MLIFRSWWPRSRRLATKAALMRSTISQAEQEAMSAQAFHQGESSAAFQAAHARFVEAAARVNTLLDIAQANLGDAAGTYVAADSRRRVRLHRILIRLRLHAKGLVMSQIMYNYPAMLSHSADMSGFAGTLQGLGADIASEQAALSNAWQGDTGMTYQVWQAQWNQAMESLVRCLPGDGQHPRIQHHVDVGSRHRRSRQMGRLDQC